MKKIFPIAILSTLILSACNHPVENSFYNKYDFDFGIEKDITPYQINDTKSYESTYFKMHGRYYFDNNIQVCFFNYSSSGFEITFIGTSLEACLYTTRADNNDNRPYIAVCIDNDYDPEKATTIQLTSQTNSNSERRSGNYFVHEHIVLAHDLENTKHTVRVYKRSECLISKVGVKSVSTDGEILPVEGKELDLKMEFFGDSVTCGYAVESPDYFERFSSRTENSLKTYANYCANELNSDVSHISCGGYPMYKSKYAAGCNPDNIPDMFSLADVEYQTTIRHEWNNQLYIPDVVVIALGANDGSLIDYSNPESEQNKDLLANYKSSYVNFINKIRNNYPDALIVVSDEILPIYEKITSVMDEIVDESSDSKLIRAKFTAFNDAKDKMLPGEGHPNKEMHQLAGHQLAEIIRPYINK